MTGYDYVVVGGGTAGCVVASRLSEDPDVSVLLLEAGGDDRRRDVEDPRSWADLLRTDADWGYETVAQAATGRVHPAPRGLVLGGSGSINCLIHLRGHRSDFDDWAAMGASGWDYASVLPYFKRSESVTHGDPRFRGHDGPLRPSVTAEPPEIGRAFVEGALGVGHRATDDFNGADMSGAGQPEMLVRDGRRESTATAYLRPVMQRPNLTVILDATVQKLVLQGSRCTGVEYASNGMPALASAAEVILCGGAIGSPHLLMLSGIGPADELAAVGVDPVCDLPAVGRNLQDHVLLAGIRYHAERRVLATGMEGAMVNAGLSGDVRPDLQLSVMNTDYHEQWQRPSPNSFTFGIGHMRPLSRGSVRLASADPRVAPLVNPAYVAESGDLESLVAGVEMVDQIVRTGAFDDWGGTSDTTSMLRLDGSDLERAVRGTISSYFHLAGSCRMGVGDDAVVDPELRVRGIAGLRVADASIMPSIVSANTNATAVMIGEKAADLIREQTPGGHGDAASGRAGAAVVHGSSDPSSGQDQFGRCHGW